MIRPRTIRPRATGPVRRAATRMATVEGVLHRVAIESHGRVVMATPKRWTGLTRRAWQLFRRPGSRLVTNDTKVMKFLEFGTANQGRGYIYPKIRSGLGWNKRRKKALYIPLTASAAHTGYKPGMKVGKDFLLAKRVRGIKPRRIAQKESRRANAQLGRELKKHFKVNG